MSDINEKFDNELPVDSSSMDIDFDTNEDVEETNESTNEDTNDSSNEEEEQSTYSEDLDLDEWEDVEEIDDKKKKKKKHKHSSYESNNTPTIENNIVDSKDESNNIKNIQSNEYGNIGFTQKGEETTNESSTYDYSSKDEHSAPKNNFVDESIISHIDMSTNVEHQESMAHSDLSPTIDDDFIKNVEAAPGDVMPGSSNRETINYDTSHFVKNEDYPLDNKSNNETISNYDGGFIHNEEKTYENPTYDYSSSKEQTNTNDRFEEPINPSKVDHKESMNYSNNSIKNDEILTSEIHKENAPTSSPYNKVIEAHHEESNKVPYQGFSHKEDTSINPKNTGNEVPINNVIHRENGFKNPTSSSFTTNNPEYKAQQTSKEEKPIEMPNMYDYSTPRASTIEHFNYREAMNSHKVQESLTQTMTTNSNIHKNTSHTNTSNYQESVAAVMKNRANNTQYKNSTIKEVPSSSDIIKKVSLKEVMARNDGNINNTYRQLITQNSKPIQTEGIMLTSSSYKPAISITNGRTIFNEATNAKVILNSSGVYSGTKTFNFMKEKAYNHTPIDNKDVKPTSLNNNLNIDRKDEKEKKNDATTKSQEEKIYAIKNKMKGEINEKLKTLGDRGYQLVVNQVNNDSTEGKRIVEKRTELAHSLISTLGSKSIATMEINRIRNRANLGEYLSINKIDIDKLNGKDYKTILTKSNNHDFSKLSTISNKTKGLSKKQLANIERARNISASKGIILSSIDKLSKEDQKFLKENSKLIFNFSSKAMVLRNNDLTLKLLKQNKVLSHYNFGKAKVSDLNRLLNNRNISEKEKILVKNLIENKKAISSFNKLSENKGRVVAIFGRKLRETFKDNEIYESAEKISQYTTSGKVIYNSIHNSKPVSFVRRKTIDGVSKFGKKTLQVTGKGIKKVGKVTHISGGLQKLNNTKPVQLLKKAGSATKKVTTAPFKGIKKAGNFISLQKAKALNKIYNNKVVKIVASPFKGLGKMLQFGSAAKKWVLSFILGAIGIYLLLFIVIGLISSFLIPALMTSIIFEEDNKIQEWVNHIQQLQADYDDTIDTKVKGSPDGKDVLGNTISNYGMPKTIGPNGEVSEATVGYTINYVDSHGNTIVKSDNSKDILSFLAVYLQQDFNLGSGYTEGMIEELFDETHPNIKVEESDIYFCDYGCDEITYYCYDLEGVTKYNTYGTREYNEDGCDPITTYCDGCECPGHDGEHTDDCPPTCTSKHTTYCDGCECPGHVEANCEGHTQKVCYGHRDVEITVTIKFLQDLLDENYYLKEDKSFIHPLYNSKLATLKTEFDSIGGWDESNKEWAWNIYNQDWFELYGVTVSAFGLNVDSILNSDELAALVDGLPADLSDNRKAIIAYGLNCVGKIPYYWGGKTSKPGLENNNFGALTTPDSSGRDKVGLDCSGFVSFVFRTVLNTYVGNSTGDINTYCYQISKEDLRPGDLVFKGVPGSKNNHVGIFAGWNEYGKKMYVHENGSDNNVSYNDVNYWTYFYRPNCYGD